MIGQVTVEEKNEIQRLFERRNGLNELAKIVTAENEALYEKLVKSVKVGGSAWLGSINGRGGKVEIGKSISTHVKSIWSEERRNDTIFVYWDERITPYQWHCFVAFRREEASGDDAWPRTRGETV